MSSKRYELVGLTYEQAREIVDDRWAGLIANGHAWLDDNTLMRPEGCQCGQCKLRDERVRPAQETVVQLTVRDDQVEVTPSSVTHCDHGVSLLKPCDQCRQG